MNKHVQIVIPMAGLGSRFSKAGFDKPKPFIDVLGKPMIYRVLENLRFDGAEFLLIVNARHLESEAKAFSDIKSEFPVKFVVTQKVTEGAACSVLLAVSQVNNTIPLLIANCDQIVDMNIKAYIDDSNVRNLDGSILTFEANSTKWSYARLDSQQLVREIREKEVISSHATVGIYYFSEGRIFVESAAEMIANNDRVNNEFYVAPAYNYAINRGGRFGIFEIESKQMHGTGTPEDLADYVLHRSPSRA